MFPRLYVNQPGHMRLQSEIPAGLWVLKDGETRRPLADYLRLTILRSRPLAMVTGPYNGADDATRVYDTQSEEFQRIARTARVARRRGTFPEDRPISLCGPELLVYIHARAGRGFATYYASSTTAQAALTPYTSIGPDDPRQHNLFTAELELRSHASFAWYTPKWTMLNGRWRGLESHGAEITEFLSQGLATA